MTPRIDLAVGLDCWPLTIPPEKWVGPPLADPTPDPDAGTLVRAALNAPLGLNAPLRRALTPDDRVAVVVDPRLPHLTDLLAGVFEQVVAAGIPASAVTLVVPPGTPEAWLTHVPDEYADAHAETHDPDDRTKLAYLATTADGRRVYLNRTVVDADFLIVLTGRGYDPVLGYAGAEAAVFPALSDTATRAELAGKVTRNPPGDEPTPARAEAAEVLWLIGIPALVQVILGPGESVAEVVAGLPPSSADGVARQDARWRVRVPDRPDLVVAAVAGDPDRADFGTLATALAAAARVVKPGGRIALLSTAAPPLPDAADVLRKVDDPTDADRWLRKHPPADPAALLWAFAARRASLFVAAGWPDDVTEELFATPLASAAEVQRLIDAAGTVLVLADADKTMAQVS